MPEAFQFPYAAASLMDGALPESRTDVWVPAPALTAASRTMCLAVERASPRRMKPGVSLDAAAAELRVIAQRVEAQEYAGRDIQVGVRVTPAGRRSDRARAALAVDAARRRRSRARRGVRQRRQPRAGADDRSCRRGRDADRAWRRHVAPRSAVPRRGIDRSRSSGGLGGACSRSGARIFWSRSAAAKIPRAHEVTLDWQVFALLLAACIAMATIFGVVAALRGVERPTVSSRRKPATRRWGAPTDAFVTRSSSPRCRSRSFSRSAPRWWRVKRFVCAACRLESSPTTC